MRRDNDVKQDGVDEARCREPEWSRDQAAPQQSGQDLRVDGDHLTGACGHGPERPEGLQVRAADGAASTRAAIWIGVVYVLELNARGNTQDHLDAVHRS